MEKEILRLFKGYLGDKSSNVVEEGLKYGLLIPDTANELVIKYAIELYGKDGSKWNQTFHKDFEIVRNAPIDDLIAQQLIHYITTYGFESLGMYDSDMVYIPNEKLEIPELDIDKLELIPIKPLSNEELTEKLMVLLTSGIALSKQTIEDIMVLSDYIDKNKFDEIKNKEVKTALYEKYNIMPKDAEDFLRYLLFKTTGSTLKIQSREMIKCVKECDKEKAFKMLYSYINKNGYEKLASIFLRNKNLFLAYKIKKEDFEYNTIKKDMNYIINSLRKYANLYHKPLKKNILDCLTNEKETIDLTELSKQLDQITIFRELRILNGIKYRLEGNKSIVHRIRNGKSYVRKLDNKTSTYDETISLIYECVYNHLIERLKDKVKDKTIYIPKNIEYAVPTTEKMFSGNIPDGSYLEVPRTDNMVYGVYWKNISKETMAHSFYGEQTLVKSQERVDLDLKQMNKSEIFGWDASYRSTYSDILFSGDMTDAPLPTGASELFYVGKNYGNGAFLITLNNFTNSENRADIPFEFVIAKATNKPSQRVYYALDPNNILEKLDMVVEKDCGTKVVGFITISNTIRFYFNDFSAGANVRSSSRNEITMGAFDYLQSYSKTQLKLRDVLKDAGAILTEKETIETQVKTKVVDEDGNVIEEKMLKEEKSVDINLSLKTITKETIIDLLS